MSEVPVDDQPGLALPVPVLPPGHARRRGKGLIIGLAAAMLVLLLGASVAIDGDQLRRAAAAAGLRLRMLDDPSAGDLRDRLLPVPEGAGPWKEPQKVALQQAAALGENKTAQTELLRRYGFVRGALRAWHANDGKLVDIRLYQFASADNARRYAEFEQMVSDYTSGGDMPIADASGAHTYTDTTTDKYGYQSELGIGYRGITVVIISVHKYAPLDRTDLADLMRRQYARL
jgi:hypothetical protein